ncbi:MAG: acyltransferase [Candidatus Bathyarchaeia archaeon]|jgi:surface polysaccharide O-acyltransferase-like enzyme
MDVPQTGNQDPTNATSQGQAQNPKNNLIRGKTVYVDLIRTVAMLGVPLLHAAGRWTITPQELQQLTLPDFFTWAVVDIYQSIAVMGVPLFLMLTGALLLQPEKTDTLVGFFKKRWNRIGLPTIFWGSAYFAWDFLVLNIPFGIATIVQGILNGPYTQFWYLYVLVGLYLFTPILRVFISHGEPAVVKYFVFLWIVGVSILPLFSLITGFELTDNIITVTGYVGYMVLGTYLSTMRLPRKPLAIASVVGIALTAVLTYVLADTLGGQDMYFFQQYFSPTVILSSVALFLLLLTVKPPSVAQENNLSITQRLIKLISINTLGIFLIHVMINESIQMGFFGFAINRDLLNPIIEVPLLAMIVLFISLAIIATLRKVPYVNRLIG